MNVFKEKMEEALDELMKEELMFFYRKHGALDHFFNFHYKGYSNWFTIPEERDGNYLKNEKGEYLFIERKKEKEERMYAVSQIEKSEIKSVIKKRLEEIQKDRKIKELLEPSSFWFQRLLMSMSFHLMGQQTIEKMSNRMYEYLRRTYTHQEIEEKSAIAFKKVRKNQKNLKTETDSFYIYLFSFLDHYFYVSIEKENTIQELKYFDISKEEALNHFKEKSQGYYEQHIQKQVESWG